MDIGLIFPNRQVFVIRGGRTQEDRHAGDWKSLYKRVGRVDRKIRQLVKNRGVTRRVYGLEDVDSTLSRKVSPSRMQVVRTGNRHR